MQEFIDLYVKMFQNAFDISGKATLKDFWIPFLINMVLTSILCRIPFIGWLFSVVLIIPAITLGVRRMRDAGYNPLFILIPFYNLYCWAQPSKY